MKGTNHIITNLSTVVVIDTVIRATSYFFNNSLYDTIWTTLNWRLFENGVISMPHIVACVLTIYVNVMLFMIGSLLPDCDVKTSIAGRMLYIPVEHRTWTHTIWFVIAFGIMAISARCFFWLACGCLLHIFYDSLSKSGICWFYPVSTYKNWTSGARVKKNHTIYLYRTGQMSETILVIFVVLVGIMMLMYSVWLKMMYGGLPFHINLLFETY